MLNVVLSVTSFPSSSTNFKNVLSSGFLIFSNLSLSSRLKLSKLSPSFIINTSPSIVIFTLYFAINVISSSNVVVFSITSPSKFSKCENSLSSTNIIEFNLKKALYFLEFKRLSNLRYFRLN